MENVQMLLPIDPAAFWRQLKKVIEEVMVEKNETSSNAEFSNKNPIQPLLKVSEVCKLFKVSKPTIYGWLKQGKLKSIKIESRRYFLWQDIEELISKSKA